MLDKLLPDLPEVPTAIKPVRKNLAAIPQPEPLPANVLPIDTEKVMQAAAASGFSQSHSPAARKAPVKPSAPAPETEKYTGRMQRRSQKTELMSVRVKPELLKFMRDYANQADKSFADTIEMAFKEFQAKHAKS